MFISQALAQTAQMAAEAPVPVEAGFMNVITQFILIILIVYFFIIRPQQKRIKRHEAELNAIIKGAKINVGGILGTVVDVKENDELLVEIDKGTCVTVLRPYVTHVILNEPLKTKNNK